ncbi:MAG TPA: hypothetical protein VIK78_01710 [Ruminiclostridium sp.]
MRKEASLEQWKVLYEVAVKFKTLKPWDQLWDMDLTTILLPEYKEPFFCSVMGKAGECIAIGTYEGFNAIHGFYYVAENHKIPPTQMIRYQNNLMCYFGIRDELSSKELNVIKELGLKFRGKNEWIYFRSFETGYAPYILDEPQVVQLTLVLQQFYMALKALIEGRLKVNFESGNILYRKYDDDSKLWLTYEAPNIIPPRIHMTPVINNELLLAKLNKLEATSNEIELDTLYLNVVINDKEFARPFLGNLLIIADCKSGMLIEQNMLSPKDDVIENILGILINYLMQMGKPKTVYVRDEYMQDYLKDLCERIGVFLKVKGKLKAIDKFEKEYLKRGF